MATRVKKPDLESVLTVIKCKCRLLVTVLNIIDNLRPHERSEVLTGMESILSDVTQQVSEIEKTF